MLDVCPQCDAEIPPDAPAGVCPRCLARLGFRDFRGSPRDSTGDVPTKTLPTLPSLSVSLPQFEILEFVGSGGMGAVYKARQTNLDRIVALKVLPSSFGSGPDFAERFAREARAMAKLVHPNIAIVFDVGEVSEMPYLVMEYVDGINLRRAIQTGELRPDQVIAIIPQICDALQYAHESGVVHRDIKPENILLDKLGKVKIADFGLAKFVEPDQPLFTLTDGQQRLGTPHYMAPEQINRPEQVDHRADIYSLGVVIYELLTGDLPLGRFAPPSRNAPIDARLDDIVYKALENEPSERYQSVKDLKNDVISIQDAPVQSHQITEAVRQDERNLSESPQHRILSPRQFAHSVLWRIVKGAAFIFHVVCLYQVVRVTVSTQLAETKNLGGWMTTTHLNGRRTEFQLDGFLIGYVLMGIASYYVFWRMKAVETRSGGLFQYPLSFLFVWILLLWYGVAVLLDATPRIVPSWIVLVILATAIHVVHRVRETRFSGKKTISQ